VGHAQVQTVPRQVRQSDGAVPAPARRGLRAAGKDNQPGLSGALDALPWHQVPVTHATTDRGHGRIETRTIQVLDAPGDLPFPHVNQAYLIERHVTALDGTPLSGVAALGVTSLDATRAGPAVLAGLVRGQWAIESLHWLRSPGTGLVVASCGAGATRVSLSF
jgi:hypothetical protein